MNQNDFFVSVIIPVYNGANFLFQTVEQVLEQNYQPLEIIVVDDGSVDHTPEVAAQLTDKIRYFYQHNSGPASARNLGIKQAKGDIIAFLDVDDIWASDKLHLQLNYLRDRPEIEIVQGLIVKQIVQANFANPQELEVIEASEPYQYINLGSAIYRREVFERVGLFDPTLRFAEDVDWFLRAWEQRINKGIIDDVTLYYRLHADNMTKGKSLVELGFVRVYKKHLDRLRQADTKIKPLPQGFPSSQEYLGREPANYIEERNFTIIANNDWGACIYRRLGYLYRTPFVGTRIHDRCYLKLLQNLNYYLSSPLTFRDHSQFTAINAERQQNSFLIGLLGDDVEIYFHEEISEAEVLANWQKRCQKLQLDNLYISYCRDRITSETEYEQHLQKFAQLDFPYKVAFTAKSYPIPYTVCLPKYQDDSYELFKISAKTFNILAWLNKKYGEDFPTYIL